MRHYICSSCVIVFRRYTLYYTRPCHVMLCLIIPFHLMWDRKYVWGVAKLDTHIICCVHDFIILYVVILDCNDVHDIILSQSIQYGTVGYCSAHDILHVWCNVCCHIISCHTALYRNKLCNMTQPDVSRSPMNQKICIFFNNCICLRSHPAV